MPPPPPPVAEPPPARADAPSEVTVEFAGPESQRRATVAFRFILAIPHFAFAILLNVVAGIAVFFAWFAALFTGRLPEGFATFFGRVIQYNARVYAYGGMLIYDRYPSFSLDEPDGDVNVRFSPGRLNRFAVLFRFILLIPAAIVVQVLTWGYAVTSVVVWLIVLVRARVPTALFQAEAAMLRYEVRYWSYAAMLTSEYPKRLFGDPQPTEVSDAAALDALPARPRITTLILSRAAKRILVLFIVLGAIFQVGSNALPLTFDSETGDAIEAAYDDLAAERDNFLVSAQGCAVAGGLDCLHSADNRLADAFEEFQGELRSHEYTAGALAAAEDLDAVTAQIVALLRRKATINDQAQYQAAAAELQGLYEGFDDSYDELEELLF
jgi:hypothetical protein